MRIRRITEVADVLAAADLFDTSPTPEATVKFLAAQGHHLLQAYVDDRPVGMISGIEITHPDKGTEMLLYELGVHEDYRRRGIGRALTDELAAIAEDSGCYGMWVLTEDDNVAANATYLSAGARKDDRPVLLNWDFPGEPAASTQN